MKWMDKRMELDKKNKRANKNDVNDLDMLMQWEKIYINVILRIIYWVNTSTSMTYVA